MDIQQILETQIPDLHPVYGGVRGRTLSSRKQQHAWKRIVEAGVRTIIDLREVDQSHSLPESCAASSIAYFHYPVDQNAETVRHMAEHFPQFCEQLDRGDFYIACAMGLHRTDIALCAYWLFHAADRGQAAPAIVGYREQDGHKPDKLMRVLNQLYACLSENNLTALDPQTFKARKQQIIAMAKL